MPAPIMLPDLSAPDKGPVYLTAEPAGEIAGLAAKTLPKHVKPDAYYRSRTGTKSWPLWLEATVERYRDGRKGGAE